MEYALLDCGDLYKIERFGAYIIARPEPQAIWPLQRPIEDWKKDVDAYYDRKKTDVVTNKEDSGTWTFHSKMPNNWNIRVGEFGSFNIQAKLAFTAFKHVGIFPEQMDNWNFISKQVEDRKLEGSLLNLFAYTGISSLVSASMGLKTVHVDAVKPVVNWANENRVLSGIEPNISWIVEDAMKYLRREVSRQKEYTAIILDPPAYGRGPNGEKWILEKDLYSLLDLTRKILSKEKSFLILNLYAMNMTPLLLENILNEVGLWNDQSEIYEQYIPYGQNKKLPLGICARIQR